MTLRMASKIAERALCFMPASILILLKVSFSENRKSILTKVSGCSVVGNDSMNDPGRRQVCLEPHQRLFTLGSPSESWLSAS
eukprot:2249271-Karenia_brevis.AAC.1